MAKTPQRKTGRPVPIEMIEARSIQSMMVNDTFQECQSRHIEVYEPGTDQEPMVQFVRALVSCPFAVHAMWEDPEGSITGLRITILKRSGQLQRHYVCTPVRDIILERLGHMREVTILVAGERSARSMRKAFKNGAQMFRRRATWIEVCVDTLRPDGTPDREIWSDIVGT
ncbi:hypothetical protein [Methylobacterium sp. WL7]|uniref:hypothetical protein n=1 Tax=Methylobacterium sp. WL7 TaxID=2603900 RepID=UPI0011C8B31C|nr:hypothetical protein [Methylobacterium sp. WL7]TXN47337.1 hypothetical protein FV233_04725 [Methylobacterium sp. WL7]